MCQCDWALEFVPCSMLISWCIGNPALQEILSWNFLKPIPQVLPITVLATHVGKSWPCSPKKSYMYFHVLNFALKIVPLNLQDSCNPCAISNSNLFNFLKFLLISPQIMVLIPPWILFQHCETISTEILIQHVPFFLYLCVLHLCYRIRLPGVLDPQIHGSYTYLDQILLESIMETYPL